MDNKRMLELLGLPADTKVTDIVKLGWCKHCKDTFDLMNSKHCKCKPISNKNPCCRA